MYVAQSGIPKPIRRSPMRLRWYGGLCGIIFIFPCHNRRPTWYKSRGLYSSALWTRCPMPRRWIKSRLEQARKFRVGLILAHQHLAQFERKLQATVMTNTAIKLVGGLSEADARTL